MKWIDVQRCVMRVRMGVVLAVLLSGLAACNGASSSSTTVQTPGAPQGTAGIGTPTVAPATGPFTFSLATQYVLSGCDASQPTNSICVSTSGSGRGTNNGHDLTVSGLQQTSVYAPGDGSACTPATTQGTLRLAQNDSITFTGTGTFCRAIQTATFTYTVTGGTGAYAQASGTGAIHVPPPSSPTDDSETWSGTLLT